MGWVHKLFLIFLQCICNFIQIANSPMVGSCLQATRWGEVEWHHSVEESDLRSRLAAAVVLKELTMN